MSTEPTRLAHAHDDWPGDAWRARRRFRQAKTCIRDGERLSALNCLRLAIGYRDRALAAGTFYA